jgi:phosphate:Na+ symporter
MRGADVGTAAMAVLFSTDLSWLSPLFIFVGVVLFISRRTPRRAHRPGAHRPGPDAAGPAPGGGSHRAAAGGPAVRTLLASVSSDLFMELLLGAVLAVLAYSSLAVVLLIAAMASSGAIPLDVALGLTLGANLGSGLVAVLTTAKSAVEERQVTMGNLLFKIMGVAIVAPFMGCGRSTPSPICPTPARTW